MKIFYLTLGLTFFIFSNTNAQDKNNALKYSRTIENKLNYNNSLNSNKLDYKLLPISEGKFKLVFVNLPSDYIDIKVYDIIGNLILTKETKYSLNTEIEFNFNEKNNKIYVVKVESGEQKLIKKINFQ